MLIIRSRIMFSEKKPNKKQKIKKNKGKIPIHLKASKKQHKREYSKHMQTVLILFEDEPVGEKKKNLIC